MTHAEAIRDLNSIKAVSDSFEDAWESLKTSLYCSPESPIHEGFYKMQNFALIGFADMSGIPPEAIHWFVYENLWGSKQLVASRLGKAIPIGSVDTFVRFEMVWDSAKDVTK